jgi:hypothetical protein
VEDIFSSPLALKGEAIPLKVEAIPLKVEARH